MSINEPFSPRHLHVRSDAFCSQSGQLEAIAQEMDSLPCVCCVSVDSLTGSIMIEFDASVSSKGVLLSVLAEKKQMKDVELDELTKS